MSYLPEEIITDILVRLPVKTLSKFRCVSKPWLNLISSRNFINTHLVKSTKTNSFNQPKLILWQRSITDCRHSNYYYLKSYSLHSLFVTPPVNRRVIVPPPANLEFGNNDSVKLDNVSILMLGSCNGLVCTVIGEVTFFIWNPSTGKSKRLLVVGKRLRHNVFSFFGFGYDQLDDDYKVVLIEFDANRHSRKNKVSVCSLRTNSWRKIRDFPNGRPNSHVGKFVNGALHWEVCDSNTSNSSFEIVSLDLRNDTYGKITQPNYGVGNCYSNLIVVEGCISVCSKFIGIRTDIWVMKEYGVRDSWVKLYTIPINRGGGYNDVEFCTSTTGEILQQRDNILSLYHPNTGTCKRIRKDIKDMVNSYLAVTPYVESLVLP